MQPATRTDWNQSEATYCVARWWSKERERQAHASRIAALCTILSQSNEGNMRSRCGRESKRATRRLGICQGHFRFGRASLPAPTISFNSIFTCFRVARLLVVYPILDCVIHPLPRRVYGAYNLYKHDSMPPSPLQPAQSTIRDSAHPFEALLCFKQDVGYGKAPSRPKNFSPEWQLRSRVT